MLPFLPMEPAPSPYTLPSESPTPMVYSPPSSPSESPTPYVYSPPSPSPNQSATPVVYSPPSPKPESPPANSSQPSPPSPPPSSSSSSLALIFGSVVGAVAFLVVVATLVVFLVRRRRRQREEDDAGPVPPSNASQSPLLESQPKKLGEYEGSNKEVIQLSPNLQTPIPPTSFELIQLPDSYKTQSTCTSGSSFVLSTGDNVQQLALVGIRTFTYEELSQATNEFSKEKFLGRGGFGSVYHGILSSDGVVVAIKQLQTGSFQGEREFLTEINVISRVHHRNLVSLVGYCISGSERLLVYEYVENNNLAFHLQGNTTPVLDWPTRMNIALGAAKGIAYLHEECHPRIIHRDIKSTNILLDSNFRAKVADFGLAKLVPDNQTHVSTRIMGTFGYLAPEFGSSGRMTEKSDVFSFGVVLLELITGRQPINLAEWASRTLDQAVLEDGKFEVEYSDPKLASNYDHEEMIRMVTCALTCVHRFPDNRPRMSQVVQVLEGNISPEKLKASSFK